MTTGTNHTTLVQEKAAVLREEIRQWLDLVNDLENRAHQIKDAASLGVMEGFLRSARRSIEQVIEQEEAEEQKPYPFMPVAEPQEITLPSFPLPGKGETVEYREGLVHLPDPDHILEE